MTTEQIQITKHKCKRCHKPGKLEGKTVCLNCLILRGKAKTIKRLQAR